ATCVASSRLSAETIMKPPTTSLASTKGPSVAPSEVTTFPLPSLPPMSTIFFWNLSFQAVNTAYISSIWAGDGFSRFPPAWLLWIHRYLGMMPPFLGSVGPLGRHSKTHAHSRFGHVLLLFFRSAVFSVFSVTKIR